MPNRRDRIDEKGKYCPVPGTTVVSTIQESDTEFWRAVYNQLKSSPTICRYYTPLPYTTYHMTAIALDTIDDISESDDWNTFVDKRILFYSKLHNILLTQQFSPNIKFGTLTAARVIVLEVHLSPEQKNSIEELSRQNNCEGGIPWFFHITLAYQYNQNLTDEDYDKIIEELKPLSNILKQKKTIMLDPPKLCYFNDMTHFTPWDGATNPFVTPPSFFSTLYSFFWNSTFGFFLARRHSQALQMSISNI